jgi:hypothetical protein
LPFEGRADLPALAAVQQDLGVCGRTSTSATFPADTALA